MSAPYVLLVAGGDDVVRGLGRELEHLGWQVRTAGNAESAVRALQQQPFDALVLDLQLSGAGGEQVLHELDRLLCRPIAVLMSGYLNVATTVRAIRDGANDVLEKPVTGHELDARLRALLNDRTAPQHPDSPARSARSELSKIRGETAGMCAVREQMQTAARYPELFLSIVGESGTGKERVAEAIHALSAPRGRYVPVSLAAIPEQLIEVELFGSAGADGAKGRTGLFELAGAGTLFFSEIADLPKSLHAKMLRVLETRTFRRVAGDIDLQLDARLIAATRRRPSSSDAHAELYDRLSRFTILLPPLHERSADIELIAGQVLAELAASSKRPPLKLSEPALAVLLEHHWPGNVRELEIVLTEAAGTAQGPSLSRDEVRAAIAEFGVPGDVEFNADTTSGTFPTAPPASEPLRMLERRMITDAWQTSGQNMSAAARSLGLPRTTLRDRLKKYGLR